MNKSNFTTIQVIIGVLALLYVFMPDLLFGPFDDIAVAGIASFTELLLGVAKLVSPDD